MRRKVVAINRSNLDPNRLPVIFLGQVSGRINLRTGILQSEKNNPSNGAFTSLDTKTLHERLTINVKCPNIIKIEVNSIHGKNK